MQHHHQKDFSADTPILQLTQITEKTVLKNIARIHQQTSPKTVNTY